MIERPRRLLGWILLAALLGGSVACGNKGELVRPGPRPAATAHG